MWVEAARFPREKRAQWFHQRESIPRGGTAKGVNRFLYSFSFFDGLRAAGAYPGGSLVPFPVVIAFIF
jgi:hypothetical protein